MTQRRLKRGVFRSLVDLQAAINRYLAEHNTDPKPFVWTATPEKIIAKLDHMNASVHKPMPCALRVPPPTTVANHARVAGGRSRRASRARFQDRMSCYPCATWVVEP